MRTSNQNSKRDLRKRRAENSGIPLFEAAGRLKTVKRSGWLRKVGITSDRESVADHSYRVAILGLFFGSRFGLDAAKIVRMCLIHDLAESEIGDLMPEEKLSRESHRAQEDLVLRNILDTLPSREKHLLASDWTELLSNLSEEAKLVWQLDKLEMYLQSKDYEKKGYDKNELLQFQNFELEERFKAVARLYPLTI